MAIQDLQLTNDGVLATMKIYKNGVTEITTNSEGVKKDKLTQLSDLANMLSTYSSGYSPLLPEGTIKYGFKNGRIKILISFEESFYNQGYEVDGRDMSEYSMGDMEEVAVNFESIEGRRYDDDDDDDDRDRRFEFSVKNYIPKTLFMVELFLVGDKYQINSHGCRMFHYFDDILVDSTKLYDFAFGNIYDNHELCFGSMDIMNVQYGKDDFRGLKSILFNWESAMSNNDLNYVMRKDYPFDFIYEYARELKDFADLNALKANTEKYFAVRKMLQDASKISGITFSSFIQDNMK